jgi:hypothetical protein
MSEVAGQVARLRPFVCLGLAYFLIGVIVPALWLYFRGEKGEWTIKGIAWSLAGGALGAVGALGITLAFAFGGKPIYVMPLVFGGAPVVNAFLTIYLARRLKEISPLFLAGLIITAIGAVIVLFAAPHKSAPSPSNASAATSAEITAATSPTKPSTAARVEATVWSWVGQLVAISLTIVCWGCYGPVLHIGQAGMHHSRMRPFLCVGLAYFLIAVIVPNMILAEFHEQSNYSNLGTLWALAGGAFGALGALGILMAFNFGGRPVFVMPLVFGGAPVINTLVASYSMGKLGELGPWFLAGLILVIAGSAMVLVLGPKGEKSQEPRVESQQGQESRVEGRGPEEKANVEASGS